MHGHKRFEHLQEGGPDRFGPGLRTRSAARPGPLQRDQPGSGRRPRTGTGAADGFGPGFGRHGGFGPGFGGPMFGRGPKVGRGDVRAAIIALLAEEPMHGYQIITELTERSGGVWRPSPGSVYPTLQVMEDQGLVTADKTEGRRVFSLTDEGRAAADAAGDGPAPWEEAARGADRSLVDLRGLMCEVGAAIMQVGQAGIRPTGQGGGRDPQRDPTPDLPGAGRRCDGDPASEAEPRHGAEQAAGAERELRRRERWRRSDVPPLTRTARVSGARHRRAPSPGRRPRPLRGKARLRRRVPQ